MMMRTLGRSGARVSAIGMGCWAIGGPYQAGGQWSGWGDVDDDESLRAVERALDLGVTLFDTADAYGAGHSERLLGRALGARRDQVVIATKFGRTIEESSRALLGECADPDYVRQACDASLGRLGTDWIDLYQFHLGNHDLDASKVVRDVLEDLVRSGRIRAYGWSTDDPTRAALFAEGPHCVAIQQSLNVFEGNAETLAACERLDLASLNRGPLAKGLLTGKFTRQSRAPDDLRRSWNFREGRLAEQLGQLDALREILTSRGRTLTQGALAWLWARSEKTLPIPGFKTVRQVEENVGACAFGPLSTSQMDEIDRILGR